MNLQTSLKELYGVGEKVAEKLQQLGLYTVNDLLQYYPRRYEDFSHPRAIDQVVLGSSQIVAGRIISIDNGMTSKRHMKITKAKIADATGQLNIVWFNQPFLVRLLKPDTEWIFSGKVEQGYDGKITMSSPVIEREGKILPVYSETVGITSKGIRKLISELNHFVYNLPDWLPEEIRINEQMVPLADAYKMIHFPESIEQLSLAKRRLAFNELFLLLFSLQLSRKELKQQPAPICPLPSEGLEKFVATLPFSLTESQVKASQEILQDLNKSMPMNRLLEGDVGSGKTVVGAIAAYAAIHNGYQTVWMAPTEILARQHWQTCEKLLAPLGIKIALLTGSTPKKARESVNEAQLIIGTQAVIQNKVEFNKVGLVIIDEQHRFGVKQRSHLLQRDKTTTPHFLSMTATPIPRTLALTIYGDLDISQLKTAPMDRLPIITRFVAPEQRKIAYQFIRQQIEAGRQAFVVCPLIEPSENPTQTELGQLEKKSALEEYRKLSEFIFPDLKVGLLHGKMKPAEKEQVMTEFKAGTINILVSTAVIEVGIDIPNATVMMIEGADRFGLAQLHQFRGRVGRASHQSYCFVFTDSSSSATFERLRAFAQTTSGFDISELDLKLRGPGDLAGLAQSGRFSLKIASLSDIEVIQQARAVVTQLLPDRARYPLLMEQVAQLESQHAE
jgi:ATP-dependent DNA helicase RecG